MAGWKNKYGNNINKYTEINDGVAFATTGKEEKDNDKNDKKMDITCYKCGKNEHYSI